MDNAITLPLPAELTIYGAGETRHALAAWIAAAPAGTQHWVLDGHAVAETDAAGVQLLLSLGRSAAAADATLVLAQPSATLRAALRTLGADTLLRLEPATEHLA